MPRNTIIYGTVNYNVNLKKKVDWNVNGQIDKKGYSLNMNYPGDGSLTWLVSEDNWRNVNFTAGGALPRNFMVRLRANYFLRKILIFLIIPGDLYLLIKKTVAWSSHRIFVKKHYQLLCRKNLRI